MGAEVDFKAMLARLPGLHEELLMFLDANVRSPRGGGRGGQSVSMPEAYLLALDEIESDWRLVEGWACELSWRGVKLDGDAALFIASRLEWAREHFPSLLGLRLDVGRVYKKWLGMVRATDPLTGTTCPRCGEALRAPSESTTFCVNCGERTLDETREETLLVLRKHGAWLSYRQAYSRYGLSWNQIKRGIKHHWLHPKVFENDATRRLHSVEIQQNLKKLLQ